jgi:hypothetical protein
MLNEKETVGGAICAADRPTSPRMSAGNRPTLPKSGRLTPF